MDLSKMKKPELIAEAKKRKIRIGSNWRKQDIINELKKSAKERVLQLYSLPELKKMLSDAGGPKLRSRALKQEYIKAIEKLNIKPPTAKQSKKIESYKNKKMLEKAGVMDEYKKAMEEYNKPPQGTKRKRTGPQGGRNPKVIVQDEGEIIQDKYERAMEDYKRLKPKPPTQKPTARKGPPKKKLEASKSFKEEMKKPLKKTAFNKAKEAQLMKQMLDLKLRESEEKAKLKKIQDRKKEVEKLKKEFEKRMKGRK